MKGGNKGGKTLTFGTTETHDLNHDTSTDPTLSRSFSCSISDTPSYQEALTLVQETEPSANEEEQKQKSASNHYYRTEVLQELKRQPACNFFLANAPEQIPRLRGNAQRRTTDKRQLESRRQQIQFIHNPSQNNTSLARRRASR